MKRQHSVKAKHGRGPTIDQRTLKNYFCPRTSAEQSAKESGATKAERLLADNGKLSISVQDSSDEDELVAVDQILGVRRPARKVSHTGIATTNIDAAGSTAPISPPSKAPVYTGTFSLKALLADRQNRTKEKETISRLEQSGSASPVVLPELDQDLDRKRAFQAADITNGRLTEFMRTNNDDVSTYWMSVRDGNVCAPLMNTDELDTFHASLPEHIRDMQTRLQDTMTDTDIVLAWLQHEKSFPNEKAGLYLCHLLMTAQDARTAMGVHDALINRQALAMSSLIVLLKSLLGISHDEEVVAADTRFVNTDKLAVYCPLKACKLSTTLDIIGSYSRTQRIGLEHGRLVLRLLLLMSLDSTYGDILCAIISTTLDCLLSALSGLEARVLMSLVNITNRAEYQLQILQILPVSTLIVPLTQQLAALFFLDLPNSDQAQVESWPDRLRLLIDYLCSSTPFHPLTSSTSYQEITHKTSLLAYATLSIPAQHSALTMTLVNRLQSLHGRIVDGKAAFISRSEAKGTIQRLADRLKYTLEAQKRKTNVFEHFK